MLDAKRRPEAGRGRGDAACIVACAASEDGTGLGDMAACCASLPACGSLHAAGVEAFAEPSVVERVAFVD